jgi:hypothetical protein
VRLGFQTDRRGRGSRLAGIGATALLAIVAAAASASTGCGGSFDPYNRLNSLRVLAIRSNPVAPTTGDTTTIDAKLFTLPGHDAMYAWSWCPVATAPGAACPVTEDQVSMLAGMPVSFTLPTAADGSTTFTNSFPADVLQTLCAGTGGMTAPDCTDGYPIQLQLTVTTDNDQVQAVRPMRLRFRPTDQANANPTVMGLYAAVDPAAAAQEFDGDPPATMPTLPRHVKTAINTLIPDGTSEYYLGTDDNGDPAMVYERLNLSWFVESGDTDHLRTTYIAGQVTITDAATVKWTPAFKKDYAADTSRLILIIRDDRQGAGWIDGTVALEPTP